MTMSDLYTQYRDSLSQQLQLLPDKPEETVDSTLRALWFTAVGNPKSAVLAANGELPVLAGAAQDALDLLIRRRLQGEPLSHLTCRQHFCGLEMLAGPEALVPRKETELLANNAIELARSFATKDVTILDVCTGSGNVALAVANALPAATVYASDLSTAAVDLARRNAAHLALDHRVQFYVSDLLAAFSDAKYEERFDLISCNPPYINSGKVGQLPKEIAEFEPRAAFDGGALGISILMRLIAEAPRYLRRDGWLTFEVGLGQGRPLIKRLQSSGEYRDVRSKTDGDGHIRVISVMR